ncbi:MAG: SpoIIE family protein phosphatase [Chloroflexi bacterium]|nr:SpoIIE family protein phosphatase [Chloroflexota bacterium]
MLKLGDFFHLPQLDALVEQFVADKSGLSIVAGFDPRSTSVPSVEDGFLPSGRSAIFRILMDGILTARQGARVVIVTEDKAFIRVPRQLRRRITLSMVEPPLTYADRITDAIRRWPDLLVVDRLYGENVTAVLNAAQAGIRVLVLLDTVFRGADVVRQLLDWGVPREQLYAGDRGLAWIIAVQRMATLCSRCKRLSPPDPAQLEALHYRYSQMEEIVKEDTAAFFQADGCPDCQHTGRQGSVAVFDVFRTDPDFSNFFDQPSLLSLEEYVLRLAALGHLPLNDLLRLDADQFRRTYNLFAANERVLADTNATLRLKLVELEAANRVLQQRTEALFSLQDIGHALITTTDLDNLADRVCRRARELCGADRALLYLLRSSDVAEVLAVGGWDSALVHQQMDAALVFDAGDAVQPKPFRLWPPGVPFPAPDEADVEEVTLRAGLRVPLVAQDEQVGLMIVQSTQKHRFEPGELALLQTFANQAALAIQRAGLIEDLLQKERMERELELARQVQQSVLPRTFPQVPGYTFAAQNEPARQVGGDFYDVFSLDSDRFGVVIADVSDKGMPAALYMALTRSLLLAEARRERSPCAVLDNVNRLLLELGEPNMFVSVFYGVVEIVTQRMTYTRAGHDRPLLLRDGTVQSLGGQGAVLGFLDQDELHLSEEQIVLASGDRLVLYTDGLTDVQSPDERLFDLDQLKSVLGSHANLSPSEMCATTFADLAAYQGSAEQFDDMTMLVVRVE